MRQGLNLAILLFALPMGAGCNLRGTWQQTAVEPPNASFPLERMTFEEDRFTATSCAGGVTQTTTGRYRWDGRTLTFEPTDAEARNYQCRQSFGGDRLFLARQEDAARTTATFERVGP